MLSHFWRVCLFAFSFNMADDLLHCSVFRCLWRGMLITCQSHFRSSA